MVQGGVMNIDQIIITSKKMLRIDEGLKLMPYRDAKGILTIGIGRCLDRKGISKEEAYILFEHDVYETLSQCNNRIPFFKDLDEVRQCVLVDMAFNLGINGLLGFKRTIEALESENYIIAAAEMLDSTWARQVGPRARRLSDMMRTGEISPEYLLEES
jgi:lysozyme